MSLSSLFTAHIITVQQHELQLTFKNDFNLFLLVLDRCIYTKIILCALKKSVILLNI